MEPNDVDTTSLEIDSSLLKYIGNWHFEYYWSGYGGSSGLNGHDTISGWIRLYSDTSGSCDSCLEIKMLYAHGLVFHNEPHFSLHTYGVRSEGLGQFISVDSISFSYPYGGMAAGSNYIVKGKKIK